jgi:hypothetical protein
MMDDPTMAFVPEGREKPALEVRVNFGVYAGRAATRAEIDRLAEWLLDEVGAVSIISEERHEIDGRAEASIHQVRIELDPEAVPDDVLARLEVERRVLERAEHWARLCVAERHAELTDGA